MRWWVASALMFVVSSGGGAAALGGPRPAVTQPQRLSSLLRVGGPVGWDNDNFLDALSKGPGDLERANEAYYKKSKYGRPPPLEPNNDTAADDWSQGVIGAELTEDMKRKVKESHTPEEEASQGGKQFRELMAMAQRAAPRPSPSPSSSNTLDSMTVEEQAAMFRQMMLQQQQQQEQQPMSPAPAPSRGNANKDNFLPYGETATGRPGRNKDADSMVNSSDVYLARLKQDSAVRKLARLAGDEDYANTVFTDPSLADIKLHTNPYIEEAARKREREMIDIVLPGDDPLLRLLAQGEAPVDLASAGVKYKERLGQRQNKKGNASDQATAAPPAVEAAPPAVEAAAKVPVVVPPPPVVETVVEASVAASPPPSAVPPPVVQVAAATSIPPPAAGAAPPVTTATTSSFGGTSDSSDLHQDARTLMGLLLKHRGGPGFGTGRIKGAEMERFETLSVNLLRTLRQESMVNSEESSSPFGQDLQVGSTWPSLLSNAPQPSSVTTGGSAALSTSAFVMPTSTNAAGMQRADSMIACLEGAVLMYKNSPPAVRESMMVTLRAALLSAVTTCNELMANTEVENVLAYEQAVTGKRDAPPAKKKMPTDFYSVVSVEETPMLAASTIISGPRDALAIEPPALSEKTDIPTTYYSGNDENSNMLDGIYDKLKSAAGNGKMGLRTDLSPQEAKGLMNDLTDMRMLLVDELNTGIPQKQQRQQPSGNESTSERSATEGSASKYQELLAKARAEKAANQQ
jgi:hypothetical protein